MSSKRILRLNLLDSKQKYPETRTHCKKDMSAMKTCLSPAPICSFKQSISATIRFLVFSFQRKVLPTQNPGLIFYTGQTRSFMSIPTPTSTGVCQGATWSTWSTIPFWARSDLPLYMSRAQKHRHGVFNAGPASLRSGVANEAGVLL